MRDRERERDREKRKMRKRKVASVIEEEESVQNDSHNQNENEGCEGNGFFACYLLTSLSPRYKGHTYIGFTVNPRRRIRQHNGEIACGAWRTKKRRPWEMVFCIYGFPTNVSALQFEWAWQHPVESLAVRKAAVEFKSLSGVANKIKLAYTMLTLPSWQNMNITVNFFSTKYMKHCAGCPSLPGHMKTKMGSLDELPCYSESFDGLSDNEENNIDKVEFDNDASTSGSAPDVSDDFVTPDSPKNPNHGDKISEVFEWNKESEAREQSGHSLASQAQSQPITSTTPPTMKSSSETSLQRVEIIEDDFMSVSDKSKNSNSFASQEQRQQCSSTTLTMKSSSATSLQGAEIIEEADFMTVANKSGNSFASQEQHQPFSSTTPLTMKSLSATSMQRVEIIENTDFIMPVSNKSGADLSQPESEQSNATLAANNNRDVSSTFVVPHEAEVIDLSTPSPICRSVLDRKKRRVSSSVGPDFIDLTNSPNFVQL